MTSAEEFFLEQIERGFVLLSQPPLNTEELNYLKTTANDASSIGTLVLTFGQQRSKDLTARCVRALEASYKDDQTPEKIALRRKYNTPNPMEQWKECNQQQYQFTEAGAISHVVQEWYLSVGREQEKKAATAAMGCLIYVSVSGLLFWVAFTGVSLS